MPIVDSQHYIRIRRGGNYAAVVFVHGILGHHSKTWGEFPFLLSQDSRLAHCDVISWGYPSDLQISRMAKLPFLGRRLPDIATVANSLSTDLCNDQIAGEYGDLILVGHSMGGLVLLQMILNLLTTPNPDSRILPRLRHLVLFATPTDGVQIPLIARVHPQAKGISIDSTLVETIRREWVARVRSVRLEDQEMPGKLYLPVTAIAGLEDSAVPAKSAASMFERVRTAPGSHTTVVKPDSRDHSSFQILREILLECTTSRLIVDDNRLLAANQKIVREAKKILFTTGSRSRDVAYLNQIEEKLRRDPKLQYYRVLMGQPRRKEIVDHLRAILAIRDPRDRSLGLKTTHLALYDKPHEQWEVFLCGNERMCVVVLPSQGGIGKFNTAEVFTGQAQVDSYLNLVQQLYHAGACIENLADLDQLRLVT